MGIRDRTPILVAGTIVAAAARTPIVSGAEENGRLSSFPVSQLPSVQHLITDFVNTLEMAFARRR
jgi:hypothetical protein